MAPKRRTYTEIISEALAGGAKLQLLPDCFAGANKTKRGVKITFVTDQITPGELMYDEGPVGVIVWVDRKHFLTNEEVEQAKAADAAAS